MVRAHHSSLTRDGQPIAAVISMEGWRALRAVAEEVVEQPGEGRLRALDPEAVAISLIGSVTNAAEQTLVSDPNQPLTRLFPGVREVFRRVLGPGEPA